MYTILATLSSQIVFFYKAAWSLRSGCGFGGGLCHACKLNLLELARYAERIGKDISNLSQEEIALFKI